MNSKGKSGRPFQSKGLRKRKQQRKTESEGQVTKWLLPLYSTLGYSEKTIPSIEDRKKWPFKNTTAHPGLIFYKFCHFWGKDAENWTDKWSDRKEGSAKYQYLREFAKFFNSAGKNGGEKILKAHNNRKVALFHSLSATVVNFSTDWRFVSGLGIAHPIETGFSFDKTVGVPYLPGSSIKGIARAGAENLCKEDLVKREDFQKAIDRILGPEGEDEKSVGDIIFFDAYPIKWPVIEVDVMNVHYKEYYESDGKVPPADYLAPTPIFFLTVAKHTPFQFVLASRTNSKENIKKSKDWLTFALLNIGAGAKTAVGYGYFEPV